MDTRPGQVPESRRDCRRPSQLAANGDYDRVDYKLATDAQTHKPRGWCLTSKTSSQGKVHNLRLGMNLRTDFAGNAGFSLKAPPCPPLADRKRHRMAQPAGAGRWQRPQNRDLPPWGGDRDRFVSVSLSMRKRAG